jgi:transposase
MGKSNALKTITGPDGRPLTVADLPSSNEQRWLPIRKARVVAAVRGGLITVDEVRKRYRLTLEEFEGWQAEFDSKGISGLRVTGTKRRKSPDTPKT